MAGGGARSLFAYYGTLPSLLSGSRCVEWNLVPLSPGHPFENNFTCAIEVLSLSRRTWGGESRWAFVLPCRCRRMPSRWSPSITTYAVQTQGKWISSPSSCWLRLRKANVAVVSARFQSGQRQCTVVPRLKGKVCKGPRSSILEPESDPAWNFVLVGG